MAKAKYVPQALRLAIIEEYRKDPRVCAVANKFGIHHARVRKWVSEAGLLNAVEEMGGGDDTGGGTPPVQTPTVQGGLHGLDNLSEKLSGCDMRQLYDEAERAYMLILLSPAKLARTEPKEAAAVIKAIRDAKSRMRSDEREDAAGADGQAIPQSPSLLAWERIWGRMIDAYVNSDEDEEDEAGEAGEGAADRTAADVQQTDYARHIPRLLI